MIEADLIAAIQAAVPGAKCYHDVASHNAVTPYVVMQVIGGETLSFMENVPPSLRNARVQVAVWSDSRLQANDVMRAIEDALIVNIQWCQPIGAASSDYDSTTELRGCRQDFSVWY